MKVLFINTFDTRGGAAIVARRLRTILEKEYQDECFHLVAYKSTDDPKTFATRQGVEDFIERGIDKVLSKAGLQYQFFPFSSSRILKVVNQLKPDVISLHNIHGGYFPTPLLQHTSAIAPVVWTLHDMWSFTGNSAHTFGDESWKGLKNNSHLTSIYPAIGINTGSFLLRQKRRIYRNSDITIVTPSRWLHDLAQLSPVFANKEITHINNGVDLNLFRPGDKREIRARLNIPADAKVLMFSADDLKNNLWKGGKEMIEVLSEINAALKYPVHLLTVGAGEPESLSLLNNFVIHPTGYVHGENKMAEYFSASDLFIYPTRADNLPNVLIEAIASGVPCITSDIGGCSEIIIDGYNGVVVKPSDSGAMASAIMRLLSDSGTLDRMAAGAREQASKNFSIEHMGERYQKLFLAKMKSKQ